MRQLQKQMTHRQFDGVEDNEGPRNMNHGYGSEDVFGLDSRTNIDQLMAKEESKLDNELAMIFEFVKKTPHTEGQTANDQETRPQLDGASPEEAGSPALCKNSFALLSRPLQKIKNVENAHLSKDKSSIDWANADTRPIQCRLCAITILYSFTVFYEYLACLNDFAQCF